MPMSQPRLQNDCEESIVICDGLFYILAMPRFLFSFKLTNDLHYILRQLQCSGPQKDQKFENFCLYSLGVLEGMASFGGRALVWGTQACGRVNHQSRSIPQLPRTITQYSFGPGPQVVQCEWLLHIPKIDFPC